MQTLFNLEKNIKKYKKNRAYTSPKLRNPLYSYNNIIPPKSHNVNKKESLHRRFILRYI